MIAIHYREGSFSEKWIEYCESNGVDYLPVNLFDTDLISTLRKENVTHLLFHIAVNEYKTDLILKDLSYVLEKEGIKVFPNYETYWHYDDKLKQKYLFEQLDLPHVPMHVFYEKEQAEEWLQYESNYPFVFKLRRGAASKNVELIKNKKKGLKLADKMFGKGMTPASSLFNDFSNKVRQHNKKRDWLKVIRRLPKTIKNLFQTHKELNPEKGYFLVQEFVEGLDRDYRMKVVDGKCWGFIRYARKNDFRASGSGRKNLNPDKIPLELVELSFKLANKLNMQSVAFDFVYQNNIPLLLEVSCHYGVSEKQLTGYWTNDLKYHQEDFRPEYFIIESLLK